MTCLSFTCPHSRPRTCVTPTQSQLAMLLQSLQSSSNKSPTTRPNCPSPLSGPEERGVTRRLQNIHVHSSHSPPPTILIPFKYSSIRLIKTSNAVNSSGGFIFRKFPQPTPFSPPLLRPIPPLASALLPSYSQSGSFLKKNQETKQDKRPDNSLPGLSVLHA